MAQVRVMTGGKCGQCGQPIDPGAMVCSCGAIRPAGGWPIDDNPAPPTDPMRLKREPPSSLTPRVLAAVRRPAPLLEDEATVEQDPESRPITVPPLPPPVTGPPTPTQSATWSPASAVRLMLTFSVSFAMTTVVVFAAWFGVIHDPSTRQRAPQVTPVVIHMPSPPPPAPPPEPEPEEDDGSADAEPEEPPPPRIRPRQRPRTRPTPPPEPEPEPEPITLLGPEPEPVPVEWRPEPEPEPPSPPPPTPPQALALNGLYSGRIMGDQGTINLEFLANARLRGVVEMDGNERSMVTGSYTLDKDGEATIMLMELGAEAPTVFTGTVSPDGEAAGRVTTGGRSRRFSVQR